MMVKQRIIWRGEGTEVIEGDTLVFAPDSPDMTVEQSRKMPRLGGVVLQSGYRGTIGELLDRPSWWRRLWRWLTK